ncbi:hypothetical protein BGZ94_006365, partial [Podila epigama]
MLGFITCLGLLVAYMIYRLVALYAPMSGDPATDPYFFSRKTMTVFASLTLFMTILAFWNAIVMYMNFNKGLKEAMIQYRVRRSGTIRSVTTVASSCHGHTPGQGSTPIAAANTTHVLAGATASFGGNGNTSGGGGGGGGGNGGYGGLLMGNGQRSNRNSRHKKYLLHNCDSATASPRQTVVMVERWQI